MSFKSFERNNCFQKHINNVLILNQFFLDFDTSFTTKLHNMFENFINLYILKDFCFLFNYNIIGRSHWFWNIAQLNILFALSNNVCF